LGQSDPEALENLIGSNWHQWVVEEHCACSASGQATAAFVQVQVGTSSATRTEVF